MHRPPPKVVVLISGPVLKIHLSLLPSVKGLDTHDRVLRAGEPVHGATSLRARVTQEEHISCPGRFANSPSSA